MDDILDEIPKSLSEFERMSMDSLLIVLGAYTALALGFLHFLVSGFVYSPIPFLFQFLINVIFGAGLLICFVRKHRDIVWSVLALVFSLILIILGGPVGVVAGLIALFGSLLAFLGDISPSFSI